MKIKYKMPDELKEKIAAGMEKKHSDAKKLRTMLGMVCGAVICFSAVTAAAHSDDIIPTAENVPEETDIIEQNRNNAETVISGNAAAEALRDEICSAIKGDEFFGFPVSDMTDDNVNDLIIISADKSCAYVIDGKKMQLIPIDMSFRNVLDKAAVSVPYESKGCAFGVCLTEPAVSGYDSDNGRFSPGYFHIENNRLVFKAEAVFNANGFETKYTGTIDFKFDSSENALVYSDMSISFSGGEWFDKCSDFITAYNGYIYGNEELQSAEPDMISDEKMKAFTGKELITEKADESFDISDTDITQTDFFLNEITNQIEGSVSYRLTLSASGSGDTTVNWSLFFVISRNENGYGIERVFDTTEKSLAEKTLEFEEFSKGN